MGKNKRPCTDVISDKFKMVIISGSEGGEGDRGEGAWGFSALVIEYDISYTGWGRGADTQGAILLPMPYGCLKYFMI